MIHGDLGTYLLASPPFFFFVWQSIRVEASSQCCFIFVCKGLALTAFRLFVGNFWESKSSFNFVPQAQHA